MKEKIQSSSFSLVQFSKAIQDPWESLLGPHSLWSPLSISPITSFLLFYCTLKCCTMNSGQDLIPKFTQTRKAIRQVVKSSVTGKGGDLAMSPVLARQGQVGTSPWSKHGLWQSPFRQERKPSSSHLKIMDRSFCQKRKQFIRDRTSTPPEIALLVCVADVAQPQVW